MKELTREQLSPLARQAYDLNMGAGTTPMPVPAAGEFEKALKYLETLLDEEVDEELQWDDLLRHVRQVLVSNADMLARMYTLAEKLQKSGTTRR